MASVVNIGIDNFETGIFDVSASIWRITLFQSIVLSAKQSKNKLQVDEKTRTPTVQTYLLTGMGILASVMFRQVLRVRGGARTHSYRMHVYFT